MSTKLAFIDPDKYYVIRAKHSSKVLDIKWPSNEENGKVHQWAFHGKDNQLFKFVLVDEHYYYIENKYSGKVLQIEENPSGYAKIVQGANTGAQDQQWELRPDKKGYLFIVNRSTQKTIDIAGAGMTNGSNAIQYSVKDQNADNQSFQVIPLSAFRLKIEKGSYVSIPSNDKYRFGTNAFSVMAYITPKKREGQEAVLTEGTILSSKPEAGGSGNGGWQLFLEKDGDDHLLCLKTDDGAGYHILKAPLNNLYDDKWVRNPNGAAADYRRSDVLFREYTHFVAAVRGTDGELSLYVNGYLVAQAAPYSRGNGMNTDSFQLKAIFKESIDKPNHYFKLKKNNNKYSVGTADWDSEQFNVIRENFTLTSRQEITLASSNQVTYGIESLIAATVNEIPAEKMIKGDKVSLKTRLKDGREKLLAQFAANAARSENVDNSIGLSIGRTEQYNAPLEGFVQHVSIWKKALDQKEIISYMDQKKSEKDSSDCVGFWKLENNCEDSTTHSNHGSIQGNAAFDYEYQVLPLYVEEQQKRNWCWAACSLSMLEYYDPMSRTMQKDIVTKMYGDDRDSGQWMHNYLKDHSGNLKESIFIKSREDLGTGKFVTNGQNGQEELDFHFLRGQLDQGNPIGLDIQWQIEGGHAVVLSGIHPKTGDLIINDPWSGIVYISYEKFVSGQYPDNGSWNAVFTTTGNS